MGSMSISSCRCCMFVSCVHDLQFVNAGRGCKRQSYGRGILQSRSHVSFYLPHPVVVSDFIICSGLWACTEML